VAIIAAIISGLARGFVKQLLGVGGIFAGTYCAYKLSVELSKWWRGHFDVNLETAKLVIFIILAAIIYLLVLWLAGLLDRLLKMAMLGWINRLFGMLFGAVKIIIIFSALAYSIRYLKSTGMAINDIDKSVTYDYLLLIADSIFFFFKSSSPTLPRLMTYV
jgi:membrane protein required for colicin V production